jgi:hypothetical protein
MLTSDWVGYGFSSVTGSKAWRIPVALQAVFIIPIIILTFLVPESPRWDVAHGKEDRALETIARLNAAPATDPAVLAQYQEIVNAVQLEKSVGSGSWSQLFASRDDDIKSRRRLLIACFIQAAQQLGGINGIVRRECDFADIRSTTLERCSRPPALTTRARLLLPAFCLRGSSLLLSFPGSSSTALDVALFSSSVSPSWLAASQLKLA